MAYHGTAAAHDRFDRALPPEPQVFEPWESLPRREATVQQVTDFIQRLADHGVIENQAGELVSYKGTVYQALAQDWMDDKSKIPAASYLAFESWATAACNLTL